MATQARHDNPGSRLFRIFLALGVLCELVSLVGCAPRPETPAPIRIGLIAPITGSIPEVGKSTVQAAELAVKEINAGGGLLVGGQLYEVILVTADDEAKAETAVAAAHRLINQEGVTALIGPVTNASAVPVAGLAESAQMVMISPLSTAPETTAGKQFVFRVGFTDVQQGQFTARFARDELNAQRAAVLFDVANAGNGGIAAVFKKAFEAAGGEVVAFEAYTTGDTDFFSQLTRIRSANPDVLFLPGYYHEVKIQVEEAYWLGIDATLLGSDSWSSLDFTSQQSFEGAFFTAQYDPAKPESQDSAFYRSYLAAYNLPPDSTAALTYDAFGLLFEAIQHQGMVEPESIRAGLAALPGYNGVTGRISFQEGSNDPEKPIYLMKIEDGAPSLYQIAEP